MKNIKILIKKILLFIIFTIIISISYLKIWPYIKENGIKIPKEKKYIETENFQREFALEIMGLESSVSWGIVEDYFYENEFNQYNRSQTNVEYIFDIEKTNGETMLLSNIINENLEGAMKNFKNSTAYYICSLNEWPETNQSTLKYSRFKANQEIFKKLDVYIRVQNIDVKDEIYIAKEKYEDFANNYKTYLSICAVLFILFILILINVSRHINETKGFKLFNGLYIEQIVLIIGTLIYVGILVLERRWIIYTIYKYLIYIIYVLCYIIISEIYFYIIRKNANKREFLLPKVIKHFQNIYKTIIVYIFVFLAYVFIIKNFASYGYYSVGIYSLIFLINTIILLHQLSLLIEISEFTTKIETMGSGNMENIIECRNAELQELGKNINNIKQGMKKAVEESMKAERLKTDLITNVSHDLKTPLTSIINYTDLLKKEKIENKNAQKYIEILEEKSKKLKNLTEDLIEASKISSGNETVNLEKLDLKEMVLQANGEFAEKFETKNLDVISNLPQEAVIMDLDGKKMWRVLENLYQNVYKYSLENTRVYVDLAVHDNIVFTIKNISKEKLNISPDELMERFIRGDSSRHTGGNGLGLSIAKDLSKLNGGTLKIEIDGDLFVSRLELPLKLLKKWFFYLDNAKLLWYSKLPKRIIAFNI